MKGHFGEGNRNNEGRDLLDMCTKNGWVVGSGWFEKR
jgi:hypothetical protein